MILWSWSIECLQINFQLWFFMRRMLDNLAGSPHSLHPRNSTNFPSFSHLVQLPRSSGAFIKRYCLSQLENCSLFTACQDVERIFENLISIVDPWGRPPECPSRKPEWTKVSLLKIKCSEFLCTLASEARVSFIRRDYQENFHICTQWESLKAAFTRNGYSI